MCGFVGWSLSGKGAWHRSHLEAMAHAIGHRGPDDRGVHENAAATLGLAVNRLSIIDLSSAGHQPMESEDGRAVIGFNGEVYNFRRLRDELISRGHSFRSQTDTEVVLRSYLEWGVACVERLCGMFALALWSEDEERLTLARDPTGMKPLYYTELPGGGGVAFASEVKAFLTLPGFRAEMNPLALQQFLEFGYCFEESETSLEGVYKLPPGHTLEIVAGRVREPVAFFEPPYPSVQASASVDDWERRLYETLSEVVGEHLYADVPVGLLLSGGLDSSVVAALAARQGTVRTISMAFADSAVDERPYARQVSEFVGSDHLEVLIRPEELEEELDEAIFSFDDLFADWGTVSTRILYRKCRESGIKAVLVGEGADEVFGGYPVFQETASWKTAGWGRLFQLYRRYSGRRYGSQFLRFAKKMRRFLRASDGDVFHAVRLFETRCQLPNNYVMKVDKASMSVSVEARAPYLDRRVVELAFGMPKEVLLRGDSNKHVLRSMARKEKLLPDEIVERRKYGASVAASWMDESPAFREFARRVIMEESAWVDRLGYRRAMSLYFSGARQGYRFPHSIGIFRNLAWRLLLLSLWSAKYLEPELIEGGAE